MLKHTAKLWETHDGPYKRDKILEEETSLIDAPTIQYARLIQEGYLQLGKDF